jgi:hypothetical protein
MRADEAVAAVTHIGTTLRVRLENLPDVLAPRLAVLNGEDAIRLRLREEINHALTELSRQLAAMGSPSSQNEEPKV